MADRLTSDLEVEVESPLGPPVPPKTAASGGNYREIDVEILRQLQILVELQAAAAPEQLTSEFVYNFLLQLIGLILGGLFGAFTILAWQTAGAANNLTTAANDLANTSNQLALHSNDLTSSSNELAVESNCGSNAANLISLLELCQSNQGFLDATCSYLNTQLSINSSGAGAFEAAASDVIVSLQQCYTGRTASSTPTSALSSATTRTTTTSVTVSTGASNTTASNANSSSATPVDGSRIGAIIGGVIGGLMLASVLFWLRYRTWLARKRRIASGSFLRGR